MVTVPWEKITEPQYAELVSMLLQRKFPDAEVLDGSGGDGGRDVQVRRNGTLAIYELKSFTGRLTSRSPNRRSQVERSLTRAAKHSPDEWHLVVPINHNPSELEWFDELRKRFPFIRAWNGRTWLNTQLAQHPDLVRSALSGVPDELLAAIREHRAERDMLTGGIPEIVARLEALFKRADEISPHYRVEVIQCGEQIETKVYPKRPGATKVEPILVTGNFVFPDTPEGGRARRRFEDSLTFGEDVELEGEYLGSFVMVGPAELGLSSTFKPSFMSLVRQPQRLIPPLEANLRVINEAGLPLHSLQLTFTERRHGYAGSVLYGQDATRVLAVRARIDVLGRTAEISLSIRDKEPTTPGMLVPALRMYASAVPPRTLRLELRAGDTFDTIESQIGEPLVDDRLRVYAVLVEKLAAIQEYAHDSFALPDILTEEDARAIYRASQLIAGHHVVVGNGAIRFTLVPHKPGKQPTGLIGDFRLAATSDHTPIVIGSRSIDLGPSVVYVRQGRLANPEILGYPAPDEGVDVSIELAEDEFVYQVLGGLDQVPA